MVVILWTAVAALGCAAFAALGIWAGLTDEGHRIQRRRALEAEMQSVLLLSQADEEPRVAQAEAQEALVTRAGRDRFGYRPG